MTSSRRILAAVLTLAFVLSCGCAVIPVGSPTAPEEVAGADLTKPFVRLIVSPPENDWTPQDVVKGMLAAMAAYPDDPTTLLQYMTQKARNAWRPVGPITVIDEADVKEGNGLVKVTGNQIARIEDDDRYVSDGRTFNGEYILKKESGGWRVDGLDNGLVMRAADVDRAYRPTLLYYLNGAPAPDGLLVSDAVHLRLKPGETLAETIIERLLKGPSSALRGAVATALTGNVAVDTITATDDKVVIGLSGAPALADTDGFKAQLRASLEKVTAAPTIDITHNGEPYILGINADAAQSWYPSMKSPAYYTTGGAVHFTSTDGAGNAVNGEAGKPNGYTGQALSKDGDEVAAVGADGIYVAPVNPAGKWARVMEGRLTAPSWHRDGSLWAFEKSTGAVLRRDHRAAPTRVAAPDLDGKDVTDLRISRDGVRVAAGVGDREVRVGAITGGSLGLMLGNFQPMLTVRQGESVKDIAWRDGEHLLVLVSGKAGQTLMEIDVGDGETTTVTSDKRLDSIAALGPQILAGTLDETTGGEAEILAFKDQQGWVTRVKEASQEPIFPLG
ncbi:LpqB family beta-propeller domain-containing protein [Nonomuraea sp. NPDC050790]|uniref:LpqB family beta-propeller domain-containing protein n=1 Tax=Nonomuraea sp. NPDC050790 TaxID=3364371 RepID=UPI00379B2363